MRYYVVRSAWFDTHPYNKPRIIKAVKVGGGKNVRLANTHGWSNQPQVVTFDAGEVTAKRVERSVSRVLGTQWISVREKDW